ncbi:MAG TPA: ABC transporter permease [Thermomicrobiales bacterium]|jgi:peptide/nickel transport system permease protein
MASSGSSAPASWTIGGGTARTTLARPVRSRSVWWRLARNRRVLTGGGVLLAFYLIALLAPLVAPEDPNHQVLVQRLKAPSLAHPMGTDGLGRDILSRAIWGARVSLSVSVVATLVSIVIGAQVGLVAGWFGRWPDNLLMRTADVFLAFPIFILLITVVAIYGSSVLLLILFLGLAAWPQTARLARAEVLSLAKREFVLAARVSGARDRRILFVHILPHLVPLLMVAATLRVAIVILVEASLSYFGLGVTPPTPSWGNMVADGRTYLATAWWITTFPGVLIVVTVLMYNLLGDGLRGALDPPRVSRL